MRKRIGFTVVAALSAVSLLAASSASAATEIGSDCQATSGLSGYTFVQLKRVSFVGLPLAAPSAGVVTKWKVNSAVPTVVGQKLQILRSTGNPNEFQTVAESAPGAVSQGLNSFDTRIPIQAGDRPAAAAAPGGSVPAPLYCSTGNPGDEMGTLATASTLGTTNTYPPAAGLVAAISAIVEPDADNDGYGDETQVKFPRSAAVQATACPLITLSGIGKPKKGSAQILVSASSQASVTVFGTVKVPKKGKKGKAREIIMQGGVQNVSPGAIASFSLVFPPTLANALVALPPSKSLPLAVTITTTDLAGQPSSTQLTLKLKGQKKGKAKAKGKGKKG
jgi:hypothetical protein